MQRPVCRSGFFFLPCFFFYFLFIVCVIFLLFFVLLLLSPCDLFWGLLERIEERVRMKHSDEQVRGNLSTSGKTFILLNILLACSFMFNLNACWSWVIYIWRQKKIQIVKSRGDTYCAVKELLTSWYPLPENTDHNPAKNEPFSQENLLKIPH